MPLLSPAAETYFGLPGSALTWIILIGALALFSFSLYKRLQMLFSGQPDPRFSQIGRRLMGLLIYGFIQKRQPRYFWAGLIHFLIFWGFLVLGLRSLELIIQGLGPGFSLPFMGGDFGRVYESLKDLFELLVLIACLAAILRRAIGRPARYKIKNGAPYRVEAYLVLGLISFLMISDLVFEASGFLLMDKKEAGRLPAAGLTALVLSGFSPPALRRFYLLSYWLHLLTFFFFLNFLPWAKHFHILTALPNIFFRKLTKGAVKPVRWGVSDLEETESLGVGKFEDFTWKHLLDFLTCTECGRCSDNCPAEAVGRPLSPKMITLKLRDYGYRKYPISPWALFRPGPSSSEKIPKRMVGEVVTAGEIWSCTTCGACEEECPVFIETIDKMIDMRRHLIETSQAPKTFNPVLQQMEKTGNPFGKPPKKRADWTAEAEGIPVKIIQPGEAVDVLYFVDSYPSYDPRLQGIAQAIIKGLQAARIDFGILGSRETDSGHQARRIGEEGLFQLLMEKNLETFRSCRFRRIVTTDPHAFNTLKKDYPGALPVVHYSQFFLPLIASGKIKPSKSLNPGPVYTYHDPCYLGRHNELYDPPRKILRSLPGLNFVEMKRSGDRSFCCGGGDVNLWHEVESQEIRMAEKRVRMAREAGATRIITACPFCLLNFEDAVKTAGWENEMKIIDLMELLMSTCEEEK